MTCESGFQGFMRWYLPWRGSAALVIFFASHIYWVSSKTVRSWY
ncbi:unnamed protein product, partial [Vitis vinifera]